MTCAMSSGWPILWVSSGRISVTMRVIALSLSIPHSSAAWSPKPPGRSYSGVGGPGDYDVRADAPRAELGGQRLRQGQQRELGRRVVLVADLRQPPGVAADVDQAAATAVEHRGHRGAAHAAGDVEIEVEGGEPLLVGDVQEAGPGLQPARVVDQGGDPAVPLKHGGDHTVGRGGVGEVGQDGGSAGAGTGVDRVAVDTDDDG